MSDAYIVRRGGGGAGGLNFKIVGGTTQPANPKENTIWVNTEQKITGWAFSADEPNSPINGLVWFNVSRSAPLEFNAASKNTLNVYPISCSQYNNSSWMPVDMMLYRDSAWKTNKNWIIQNGKLKYAGTISQTAAKGSYYESDAGYIVKTNGNEYYAIYFGLFDLTGSAKIVIELLESISYKEGNFPALIVSKDPPVYSKDYGISVSAAAKVILAESSAVKFSGIKQVAGNFDGQYYLTLTVAGSSSIPVDKSGYLTIKDFYVTWGE